MKFKRGDYVINKLTRDEGIVTSVCNSGFYVNLSTIKQHNTFISITDNWQRSPRPNEPLRVKSLDKKSSVICNFISFTEDNYVLCYTPSNGVIIVQEWEFCNDHTNIRSETEIREKLEENIRKYSKGSLTNDPRSLTLTAQNIYLLRWVLNEY